MHGRLCELERGVWQYLREREIISPTSSHINKLIWAVPLDLSTRNCMQH